jgi:hypothetical protein
MSNRGNHMTQPHCIFHIKVCRFMICNHMHKRTKCNWTRCLDYTPRADLKEPVQIKAMKESITSYRQRHRMDIYDKYESWMTDPKLNQQNYNK